jgi:hypothetical protein
MGVQVSTGSKLMSAHEFGVYLETKGLLHDCCLAWYDIGEGRFSFEVPDVNATTHGLPEYAGARSLLLELDGAAMMERVVPPGVSKVFEASASSTGDEAPIGEFRVTFWPAGHMTLTFLVARVTESVVAADASGASTGELQTFSSLSGEG